MTQRKRDTLVLQVGVYTSGWQPHTIKNYRAVEPKRNLGRGSFFTTRLETNLAVYSHKYGCMETTSKRGHDTYRVSESLIIIFVVVFVVRTKIGTTDFCDFRSNIISYNLYSYVSFLSENSRLGDLSEQTNRHTALENLIATPHSPWKPNSHCAVQEISHLLLNPNLRNLFKKSPHSTLLRKVNPVRNLTSCFLCPTLILSSVYACRPIFQVATLPFRFSVESMHFSLISIVLHVTPIHQIHNIWWRVKKILTQFSPSFHKFRLLMSKYSHRYCMY
jgi:hypothetical protein